METSLNSLQSGQSLDVTDAAHGFRQLWSEDRQTRLTLQTDGNLVIYTDHALWSSRTQGLVLARLWMRPDGDLVLVDAKGNLRWHTNTAGHPGAHACLQDDSNFVIYTRGTGPNAEGTGAIWSSGTGHGEGGFFGALGDAAGAAGDVVKAAGDVVSSVGDAIGSIPVIGKPFEAVFDLSFGEPFAIASGIANGERLDRVALGTVEREVSDIKAIAPYVQMVIAEVPGIGTGISAAIGAGLALASGQTIDAALLAAARGALPGGAVAAAAFDVGASVLHSAVTGAPLAQAVLSAATSALPIPPAAKNGLAVGLQIGADFATHKAVDFGSIAAASLSAMRAAIPSSAQSVFDAAVGKHDVAALADIVIAQTTKALPASARTALQAGLALGHAQGLQELASGHRADIAAAKPIDLSPLNALQLGGMFAPSAPKPAPVDLSAFNGLQLGGMFAPSAPADDGAAAKDAAIQAQIADLRVKQQIAALKAAPAPSAPAAPHTTRNTWLVGAGIAAAALAKFFL